MNVVFSKHFCFRKRGRGSVSLVVINVLGGQSVFFPSDSAHLILLSLRLCKPLRSTGEKKRRKMKNCFVFAKQHVWSRPREYRSVQGAQRCTRCTESLKLHLNGAAVYPSPLMSFEYLELMDKVNLGKHFIEEQLTICVTILHYQTINFKLSGCKR